MARSFGGTRSLARRAFLHEQVDRPTSRDAPPVRSRARLNSIRNPKMSPIAGIDLGTTNSLIGVMDAGFPVLLADTDGGRLTPSVVHFPKIGEPLVGRAAARMRTVDPKHTVYSIKRFIGRRAGEEADDVAYALAGQRGAPVRVRMRLSLIHISE